MCRTNILEFQFHKGTINPLGEGLPEEQDAYFNSIKVRLTLDVKRLLPLSKEFQFHKGTINPKSALHNYDSFMYFNSIKVRLTLTFVLNRHFLIIFQFHKGTINPVAGMADVFLTYISIP